MKRRKEILLLHTGYMMEHNLSNINTGVRKSSKPYFFTVSTQTAMKAIVSDSVPKKNKITDIKKLNFMLSRRNFFDTAHYN